MSLLDSLYNQEREKYSSGRVDKNQEALLNSYNRLLKGDDNPYVGITPEPEPPGSDVNDQNFGVYLEKGTTDVPKFSWSNLGSAGWEAGIKNLSLKDALIALAKNAVTQGIDIAKKSGQNSDYAKAEERSETIKALDQNMLPVDLTDEELSALIDSAISGNKASGYSESDSDLSALIDAIISGNKTSGYSDSNADLSAAIAALLGLEGNTEGQNSFFNTGDLSGIYGTSSGE